VVQTVPSCESHRCVPHLGSTVHRRLSSWSDPASDSPPPSSSKQRWSAVCCSRQWWSCSATGTGTCQGGCGGFRSETSQSRDQLRKSPGSAVCPA